MKIVYKPEKESRIIIENIKPDINSCKFAIKRTPGESVTVSADILCDGHDALDAIVMYKKVSEEMWKSVSMYHATNDRWMGTFYPAESGDYVYSVKAWVDTFLTWQNNLIKKFNANQDIAVDILDGAILIRKAALRAPLEFAELLNDAAEELENSTDKIQKFTKATDREITAVVRSYPDLSNAVTTNKEYPLIVNEKIALFSSWYEFFPRSFREPFSKGDAFKKAELLLPAIAAMGFDVVYFPPIHPIGTTNRKGKNNSLSHSDEDPGSPWAIGSKYGGHMSIDPELGTLEDFQHFVKSAQKHGITVAIDLAFQCSPDHPYCKNNPEWFKHRADGSVRFAENPPKRYEDIVPFDFESNNWKELWEELLSVVLYWVEQGITIFRVDNPHTKPITFWEWLISQVRSRKGDILFLAEAFTRPKIMYRLAKIGFTQSYTYFTWRNTKKEIREYITELTKSEVSDYFRPNFWPNTPDILPEYLQFGGEKAFEIRLILAATLSSNYGIYAPAFESAITDAIPGKEEYLNSEKYEYKTWDGTKNDYLIQLITAVNMIRKENISLQTTNNVEFLDCDNEQVITYYKSADNQKQIIIIAVNLDPFHTQKTLVHIPIEKFNIAEDQIYLLEDLLSGERYFCTGHDVTLNIGENEYPAFIFNVRRRMANEIQFSYY